jgi:Flp pilus assembly protein TadD
VSNSNAALAIIRSIYESHSQKLGRLLTSACVADSFHVAWFRRMVLQEQYDEAMFDFSQGDFNNAIVKLRAVLAVDPTYFDAQLALGMAFYRIGNFAVAISEGHKAEKLRPKEQLVHTNLSLFYMRSGDKVTAEKHGLQAKIESWRADAAAASSTVRSNEINSELLMAKTTPMPIKFPSQPWKKKPAV